MKWQAYRARGIETIFAGYNHEVAGLPGERHSDDVCRGYNYEVVGLPGERHRDDVCRL